MTTHERLIELVPDIVALKFGCRVRDFMKGTLTILRKIDIVGETPVYDFVFMGTDEEPSYMRSPYSPNWEILGRDITLADVLLAMNLTGHAFEGIKVIGDKMHFDFPTGEEIHFIDPINGTPGTNYEWGHAEWDLKLPFHLQSQETQDFIGRIIGAEV